jgi:hypothetical protein
MTMAGTRRESGHQKAREMAPVIRYSAEQATRLSRDQIEAGQQAAQASIDLLRTNVEVFQRTVESTMDFMVQMVGRNANGAGRTVGGTNPKARPPTQSSRNGETIIAMTGALSDIWGEWVSFVQKRARHNVDHWNLLFSCRTPQDFVIAQSELLRGDMEDFLESGRRIAVKSLRLSPVGRKIARITERASRAA